MTQHNVKHKLNDTPLLHHISEMPRTTKGYLIVPTALHIDPIQRLSADKAMLLAIIHKFITFDEADVIAYQHHPKRKAQKL
jgi:hypothetical protein